MKCLVTGATGFIGRALCRSLAAADIEIVALSEQGLPTTDDLPTRAIDLSRCDVAPELWQGVDAVVHLAGIAHRTATDEQYEQINHQATMRLARNARDAGVGCFVFLSSVKAMGTANGVLERVETDALEPQDNYGRSKWLAEKNLRRELEGSEMSLVILRPALVYGEGVKGNLATMARAVRAGMPRPPCAGGRSMIALPDLVSLIMLLITSPPQGQRTWMVSDGECYSTRRIYDEMRVALGRRPGVAWLPLWGWRLGLWLVDAMRPQSESVSERILGYECYSNKALCEATQWSPAAHSQAVMTALVVAGKPC